MATTSTPTTQAPKQGVMERRDPLPAGRYWVYIDESEVERWAEWVKASEGKVKPVTTEAQLYVPRWIPAVFATRWDLSIIQSVKGYWILFDVVAPVKWVGFGYPTTVIDPAVRSSTDVITAPAPEPEWNPIGEMFASAKWFLFAGGALYLLTQAAGLKRALGSKRGGS